MTATITARRTKTGRLEVRVSSEQEELITRAAALSGRSSIDFIVSSVQCAAEETIRAHQVITLSARDGAAFVEAVLNPPEPNENLRASLSTVVRS